MKTSPQLEYFWIDQSIGLRQKIKAFICKLEAHTLQSLSCYQWNICRKKERTLRGAIK